MLLWLVVGLLGETAFNRLNIAVKPKKVRGACVKFIICHDILGLCYHLINIYILVSK